MELLDKSLLIMGGASGLGLSAARAFVAAGARVVVVDLHRAEVEAAGQWLGSNAIALCADPCEPATAVRAVDEAVSAFGRLDGLYHAAGGGRRLDDGPIHEITDAGWRVILDLNLNSLMYSNRAAVRQFLTQKSGGSILNLGSVLGSSPAPPLFVAHAYAASKAAVIGLSKSLAACYAEHSIRVNVIAPGLIQQRAPIALGTVPTPDEGAVAHFIHTKQPLDGGRIGQPGDFDAAAVYFMSDGSRFTTAQVLSVDGGWSVSEGQWNGSME